MKTLDEVIHALEVCTSGYCSNHDGDCPYLGHYKCNEEQRKLDALHYLKEYKTNQEDPDGDHQQLEKAQKLLWEFYQNDPLTWDELKQMEGKPVWVEWTKTEESYWCFVGEWFDDDEMRIYHIGRDYADYIHKTIYTPDIVQAYMKER